jgi:hypothetical protein
LSTDPQEYIAGFRKKTGRMPSQVELTKALGLSPEKAVRELMHSVTQVTPEVTPVTPERSDLLNLSLVVGLLFIAVLTFALSVYFTGLWFTSMFNFVIAGAISVSMVSYMVIIPQAAMYVRGIVKVPVWGTFAIALVFSMGSTVAGQYNQLTENVDIVETNDRATLRVLEAEEQELLRSIEANREQRAFHQKTMESLSDTAESRMENWQYINTERNTINELGYEIEQEQARLSEVRAQILSELDQGSVGATVERVDFYSWLARLLGKSPSQVEFMVSALPAIFIDIIAALSLNVALQVRRKA